MDCNKALLRLTDIGTAFEQIRGQTYREVVGQSEVGEQFAPFNRPGIVTRKESYIALFESNTPFEVRHQRRRACMLDHCLTIGCFGCESAFETYLCQLQALFTGFERLPDNLKFGIKCHEFVVGLRHLGNDGHLQGTLRFDRLQVLCYARRSAPPEIAPEVDLPREEELDIESIDGFEGIAAMVFTLVVIVDPSTDIRNQRRRGNAFALCHFTDSG